MSSRNMCAGHSMLSERAVPADCEAAEEGAAEDCKEVADVHGHDSQHAGRYQVSLCSPSL
jgi:hypothetical protein